jgi:hypothetical protein
LMGRGKPGQHLPGNILFRNLIKARATDYHATDRSQLRDAIASEIMAEVESTGGRFLQLPNFKKEGPGQTSWVVIPENATRAKVKQALRDTMKTPNRSAAATTMRRYRVSSGAGVMNPKQRQRTATFRPVSLFADKGQASLATKPCYGPKMPISSNNFTDRTPAVEDCAQIGTHAPLSDKVPTADMGARRRRSCVPSSAKVVPPQQNQKAATSRLESQLLYSNTFPDRNHQGSFEISQSHGPDLTMASSHNHTVEDWTAPVEGDFCTGVFLPSAEPTKTNGQSGSRAGSADKRFGPRNRETNQCHHNPPQPMQVPTQQKLQQQQQQPMIPREVVVHDRQHSFASSFFPDVAMLFPTWYELQPPWYALIPPPPPPSLMTVRLPPVLDATTAHHSPYVNTNHRYVYHQQQLFHHYPATNNNDLTSASSFDQIWDSDDLSCVE